MENPKFAEIKEALKKRLNVTELDPKADIKSLGFDSLDVVETCMNLEDNYGIAFQTEELSTFKTLGDLLDSIEKKIGT